MKKSLVLLFALLSSSAGAQEVEVVDSIDMDSGNYIIEYVEDGDSIRADTIDLSTPSIPQIPLEKCDSLTLNSPGDRYGVVWKAGKCGIYDIIKWENVTKIEYKDLWYSFRKEMEGEYYSYFGWDEDDTKGIIGVAEVNNQFIAISMPKKEEDDNNSDKKER
jgi:hypothetical protein